MDFAPDTRVMPRRSASSEPESLGRDLLFAAASVALLTGLEFPAGNVPVFVAFVIIILSVSAKSIVRSPFAKRLFVLPLLMFLVVHLVSAFRISNGNGLLFLTQALVVGSFVAAFINRYGQIGMGRYLRLTGIGMTGLLIFVVAYHVARDQYISYKLLSDPKAVFDLLPLMLLVLRRSRAISAKFLLPVLLPVFVVALLLSGERKAYILLLLVSPYLLNFRSLTTYLLPLALGLALSLGLSFDRSGYVERQFNTFSELAHGSDQKTISDEARSWAIRHAAQLFVDNPVIGVGTNGYSRTIDPTLFGSVGVGPHNEWLRVAAENGITGLLLFSATIAWGLIGLLRRHVDGRPRTRSEKSIAFAVLATLLVYFSFEALDFIVLTAFMLTPFVQFLRLDPNDQPYGSFRWSNVRSTDRDLNDTAFADS